MLVAFYVTVGLYVFGLMAVRGAEDDATREVALRRMTLDKGLSSRSSGELNGWIVIDTSDLDSVQACNAAKVLA
jgi:hypothetical protein